MRISVKKIYNKIMYTSFFFAFIGVYCKITYKYIDDDSVVTDFLIGIAIATIMSLALRRLFHQLDFPYLK